MNDLIRREDAISMLKELRAIESDNFTKIDPVTMMIAATIADCIEGIVELPSAESERMAKVIIHKRYIGTNLNIVGVPSILCEHLCGACKKKVIDGDDYCSHCGARLEWK